MKAFVAAVLALAVCVSAQIKPLTDEERTKLAGLRKECSAATGLNDAVLEDLKQGVFPSDPKLKDFLFCMAKRTGMMNEAGEIQLEVVKAILTARLENPAEARKVLLGCRPNAQAPSDERFAHFVKCVYEARKLNIVA